MSHTDLTPGNVLVQRSRLTGVLDGGGFAPADPSLDLVGAWHLLNAGPRASIRDVLRCTRVEWERGKAWRSSKPWALSGPTRNPTKP